MSEPGYRAEQLIIPGLKHFVLETLEPAIGMLTGYERQNPRGEERYLSSSRVLAERALEASATRRMPLVGLRVRLPGQLEQRAATVALDAVAAVLRAFLAPLP